MLPACKLHRQSRSSPRNVNFSTTGLIIFPWLSNSGAEKATELQTAQTWPRKTATGRSTPHPEAQCQNVQGPPACQFALFRQQLGSQGRAVIPLAIPEMRMLTLAMGYDYDVCDVCRQQIRQCQHGNWWRRTGRPGTAPTHTIHLCAGENWGWTPCIANSIGGFGNP